MKNLIKPLRNAIYLLLVIVVIVNLIISKVQRDMLKDLHRRTIELTYRKAWMDGANSLINKEWDSRKGVMEHYRKDSLAFVGLLYSN